MTRQEANKIIIEIRKTKLNKYPMARDLLRNLTDRELTAVIAVDTSNFGRSWKDSVINAEYHIQDRDRAIRLFSREG